jgi:hypothetical protein
LSTDYGKRKGRTGRTFGCGLRGLAVCEVGGCLEKRIKGSALICGICIAIYGVICGQLNRWSDDDVVETI